MSGKDLQTRIENLPDEQREKFDDRIDPFEENLEQELLEQHWSEIDNQIGDDESELNDFNVVVSGFLEQDGTDYTFIRTEPLIHDKDKNFDVLVAAPSKGVAVLVEIERSLLDRLPSKLSKFDGKMDVVRSNGADFDVDEYFEKVISTVPADIDYVLASQVLDTGELKEKARDADLNFIAWMLGSHGNRCRISAHTIKEEKTGSFDGHADDELTEYINSTLENGVDQQEYISFCHSSSKYLKLKHMSLTLVNRYQRHTENGSFDYEDWKRVFEADVDLYNYLEEEKRTLYKRYIKYAKEVGVVKVEEDNGDLFENEFRVVSQATKDQEKLVDELMEKMADSRMQDDFEEALREKKLEVVTELERDHATGGPTLDDFFETSDEEETANDD
ncbi:hypothetical protein PNP85_06305 [Halobacterium salinarum]|uniref:hypothetical protein n=1 Tax=Halobacterium salinarum TaxID=2242 RepID=UPI002554452C|nr:hypothetical protein [Halobacterium salinarum]MDL0139113.1 hypothetical protein [Halobacterium salinarum]